MILLHTSWLYITLPWLYFTLLDSTLVYLYFTLDFSTLALLDSTNFYHGSTSLNLTLQISTMALLHATWLYICFSLPSCVWTLGRVRSCNCGGHWCGCHPVCSLWCCYLHCNASHFMPAMEKHVSIVPIWLKQEVVDLLLNDQLLH